jgi:hypothetical protein
VVDMVDKRQHFNPTDVAARKNTDRVREQKAALQYEQYRADFQWVLDHPQGRRFMWHLLARTGLFSNPFTGNSETFFKCGEMNVGQMLMADITSFCPEKYVQMMNDYRKVTANVK